MITVHHSARPGDFVLFKGKGPVFEVLSRLLWLFERWWDRWGWHTAIVGSWNVWGLFLIEATANGVELNHYSWAQLADCRFYRWLDQEPPAEQMSRFIQEQLGMAYDVAIYFWTALAIIIRHYFNRPIPKLLDRRFSCWELAADFCLVMGKPIVSRYDVIILTDLLQNLDVEASNE